MNESSLVLYFVKYLKEIRNVEDSTVKHYQNALRTISNYLSQKGIINGSIYEISEIEEIEKIKEYLKNDPDFIAMDNRGHRMYSAGFNNYYKFALGGDFSGINQKIELMDFAIPYSSEKVGYTVSIWKRSTIIKNQVINLADYKCEFNSQHHTFISKSTNKQYMEGHHLLME